MLFFCFRVCRHNYKKSVFNELTRVNKTAVTFTTTKLSQFHDGVISSYAKVTWPNILYFLGTNRKGAFRRRILITCYTMKGWLVAFIYFPGPTEKYSVWSEQTPHIELATVSVITS
jgi:hypothetical protein